jgi:hypothetical protein
MRSTTSDWEVELAQWLKPQKIAQDVMEALDYGEESVSVAMEEIKSSDWAKQRPDRECPRCRYRAAD